MAENHSGSSWHLEKSISVSHIITTLSIVIGMVTYAMRMDTRVTVLEAEEVHNQHFHTNMETRVQGSLDKLDAALIRIEAKLDNKVDKR